MHTLRLLITMLLLSCTAAGHAAERVVTVFAAASMSDALEEVGRAWTAAAGVPLRFSFASTATLARQIESGAPAGVFVSADQEWMDYLAGRNLIQPATRTDVVTNTLVLVAPADSRVQLQIAPRFAVAQTLGRNGRLAIADPASVPAGRYAQAALTALGVWDDLTRRIVAADNVRTALNFVALGEAPLGIVYGSDAHAHAKVRVIDTFPADTHPPIRYPAAATRRASAEAVAFVRFLGGEEAQRIFRRHGFGIP